MRSTRIPKVDHTPSPMLTLVGGVHGAKSGGQSAQGDRYATRTAAADGPFSFHVALDQECNEFCIGIWFLSAALTSAGMCVSETFGEGSLYLVRQK